MSPMLLPLEKANFSRRRVSAPLMLPPPVEGWVSQNDPNSQNMTSARILENIVPLRNYAETRRGCAKVAKAGAGLPCESLMSYESGAQATLISAGNGKLFDLPYVPQSPDDPDPPEKSVLYTGLTNNRIQSVAMADATDTIRLVMVNGADGILTYEPILGVENVTPTPEVTDLLDVTTFKGRLWFTQDGTSTLWYGPPLSNQPTTLTPFYVGPLLRRGGDIVAIDSMSIDGGSGPDDYLVVISSQGDCVIFSGVDPATDFQMVGLFKVSQPVGVRCLVKMGKDLMYFGSLGPQPLTDLLQGLGVVDNQAVKIQDQFEEAYSVNRGAHGFEVVHYSKESWVICNVPQIAPTSMDQYVLNLSNNSWFRITGWNAICWAEHEGEMYFGDANGKVYIANYGLTDDGKRIQCDLMYNWNDFGVPEVKKFNNCKVTLRSIAKPKPRIDMMADYVETEPTSQVEFPGEIIETPWDVSPWNDSPWSSSPFFSVAIFGLKDYGYVGALRYRENVKESYTQIFGFQIIMEVGDIL